ncbi:KpsF/GutQ family sugar-phosphate isomerase [Enterococcus gallinarum]|uniref:KpsF/GutQ family sugar-phosphate isomerase n=1 Tax=Enterococcus gallinarum TaxID=1353 RepID=UPI0035CA96EE
MDILERAKEVISTEQQALQAVSENLSDDFLKIVQVIQERKGKVVFTGVGKSGHIGTKLAATFSSLGVTSIFVHSTEALHGDLGMINHDDIVFMMSNSGETAEILAMLPSLNKIGCTKIAFTSQPDSTLSRSCEMTLSYQYETEADRLNLAPTTSAIIMLSLGDSLGVVLSESLKFEREDFHLYHPGGALGAQLKSDK